jgi:hypothetical protein
MGEAGRGGGKPAKAKAEVNLVRLAGAFNALVAGDGDGQGSGEAGEAAAAPEWRKLEAYARRMRELLTEVRRGDTPPPAERLAEYERMLSAAAAAADTARRKQDELPGGVAQVRAPCRGAQRAQARARTDYRFRRAQRAYARARTDCPSLLIVSAAATAEPRA